MKKIKPFQYRNRNVGPLEYDHPQSVSRTGTQEVLSGIVQGMDASDIEERTARALDRIEASYDFRVRITSEALGPQRLTRQFANIKGETELDFLCEFQGRVFPIFVDGEISHYFTPAQAEADRIKTNVANEFGRRFGWKEAVRIPFWKLTTQDMADKTIRDIFL